MLKRLLSIFLLIACFCNCGGDDGGGSGNSGTYHCRLVFPSDIAQAESEGSAVAGIDCAAARIADFEFTLSIAGVPYSTHRVACSRHGARIENVPTTVDRVEVCAITAEGEPLLFGFEEVFIAAGGETGGRITLAYITGGNGDGPVAEGDDADGDGFDRTQDCDDADGEIYPGAPETPNNGVDEDCDGEDLQTILPAVSFTIDELNMTFVRIPAGTFTMGSPPEEGSGVDEEIQHEVTLTRDYYLQATEVTQQQWETVAVGSPDSGLDPAPSYFDDCGSDCPVESVNWSDAQIFIITLEGRYQGRYDCRLPTEAEWEYAARGGSPEAFANGPLQSQFLPSAPHYCPYEENLDIMGWYCYNSGDTLHPVRQKEANVYGLFDMHGNVSEWCQDWYAPYSRATVEDPAGPYTEQTFRIHRGGSWEDLIWYCRSASRRYSRPDGRDNTTGFRLVCSQIGQ